MASAWKGRRPEHEAVCSLANVGCFLVHMQSPCGNAAQGTASRCRDGMAGQAMVLTAFKA